MPNPFDEGTIPQEEVAVTLEDLVGEGRKYRDPNELAKAYNSADAYIQKLKADKLEADARAKVLQDLVDARNAKPPEDRQTPPAQETPREERNTDQQVDISELVRKELSSAEEQRRKSDNINRAADTLSNHYGSPAKAQEAIRQRAEQLGVKFEWLRDVAADSPQALFASMGITPNARPSNSPGYTPEVNLNDRGSSVKNYAYFENIRKQDVKLYNSAEVRKQMMDSARDLGDKFFAR